jgi:hypothetical protein
MKINIDIDDSMIESLREIIDIQRKENDLLIDSSKDDEINDYINLLIENNLFEFRNRISK